MSRKTLSLRRWLRTWLGQYIQMDGLSPKKMPFSKRRLSFLPQVEGLETRIVPTATISLADSSLTVAYNGTATIHLERSGDTGEVSVNVQTQDGTAVSGTDYSSVNTTVSFGDGQMEADVSVNTLGHRESSDVELTVAL